MLPILNIGLVKFADEIGIYVTFNSAAFTGISLPESKYAIQGAGMVLYISAFTAKETEVSIVCEGTEYRLNIFNAKGEEKPTSIDNNIVAPKAVKMIENGQLIIIRDGIRYNAQGQQF